MRDIDGLKEPFNFVSFVRFYDPSTHRDSVGRVAACGRDTGTGIAPQMLSLVFEPFRQIDSAPSRKYEGAGLGLSLVKSLIELHGGEVSIESVLEKGTSVSAAVPSSRRIAALMGNRPMADHAACRAPDHRSGNHGYACAGCARLYSEGLQ